jgi:hypothetical protein
MTLSCGGFRIYIKIACDYTIAGERGKTGVGELAIHAKALGKWGLGIFSKSVINCTAAAGPSPGRMKMVPRRAI